MELTDEDGEIAWRGTYKAWGLAEETRSDKAKWADIRNPLRFQGQYWDVETGLHYNRYRYYDPQVGRFIGKDPIGFSGGFNLYQYTPNPIYWIDPLGLAKRGPVPGGKGPHNEVITAWGNEVRTNGGTVLAGGGVLKETLIPTPGGHKSGRRADIVIRDSEGKLIYGQVGRAYANGDPVKREMLAMEDLRHQTQGTDIPDDVEFRTYCPCKDKK
ncbi:RHS repeat-associated core domain-containing protein [Pseudomonas putida]